MKKTKEVKLRKGKKFWIHVSPGHCRCDWSATTKPSIIGDTSSGSRDWYIMAEGGEHIGSHKSKHKFYEFIQSHGILPKPGKQICVQLVEVKE